MPETKTVIKVLRRSRRGYLYSAIVRGRRIQLRYTPGETLRAPDGMHPFAFEELRHAREFIRVHRSQMERRGMYAGLKAFEVEIWECEATEVRPVFRIVHNWRSLREIRKFWVSLVQIRRDPCGKGLVYTGSAPEGCVSCQTIKLVRKVDG